MRPTRHDHSVSPSEFRFHSPLIKQIDVSVNSPYDGVITEILVGEESTVAVGQDLFRVEPGEKGAAPPRPKEEVKPKEEPKPVEKAPEPQTHKQPKPTPQVKAPEKPRQQESAKEKPGPKQAASAGNRGETRVKMNRMRQTIAKRLKDSQNAAASLTTFNEIDMSALMAFRKKYKDEVLKSHDVKLGYMSAFAKAACLALKEIPAANAYIEVSPPVQSASYFGPMQP